MNLWIMSQDETILEKVERVKITKRELEEGTCYEIQGKLENTPIFAYETMGVYATEERAKEILKEIKAFIENNNTCIYCGTQNADTITTVYQMPQE